MEVTVTTIPLITIIVLASKEVTQFSIGINQMPEESTSFFQSFQRNVIGKFQTLFKLSEHQVLRDVNEINFPGKTPGVVL